MFVGSTNEDVQIQTPEQQLPFVSSGAFSEQRCVYESQTNDKKKSLAAHENKQYVKEVGGETKTSVFIKVPYQYKPYMYLLQLNQKDVFISQDVLVVP